MKELIALVLLIYLLSKGRRCDRLNPYFLSAFFPLALLVYSPSIGGQYLPKLSLSFICYVSMAFIAFLVGLNWSENLRIPSLRDKNINFYICLAVGILPHIMGYMVAGFPVFSDNLEMSRASYKIPIVSFLHLFLYLAVFEAYRSDNRQRRIAAVLTLLFFSSVMVSRFDVAMAILVILAAKMKYSPSNRVVTWKTSALFMVVPLIIFSYVSFLRGGQEFRNYAYMNSSGLKYLDGILLSVVLPPYYYLTTGLSNLALIFESNDSLYFGRYSINPVISILQLDSAFPVSEKVIRHEPFNTHTFLADFLLDFGILGSLVASLILGQFVGLVYHIYRTSQSNLSIVMWGYCSLAVLSMPFSNHFTSVGYPIIFLVILVLVRFLTNLVSGDV